MGILTQTETAAASTMSVGARLLRWSAITWFTIAFIGQWIFVYYIAAFYLPILRHKGFAGLQDTHLPNGYVEGDFWGNLWLVTHLIVAIVIIGGGTLQLIPWIRANYPRFHRLLGRSYVGLSIIASLAGLYLIWTRGMGGNLNALLGLSLDAVLIILCSFIAVRFAIQKNFVRHRRWALRLFMVVSAVWFFRIGLMAWIAISGGIGIDFETFSGPFINFLYFAQIVVPLSLLELYLRAGDSDNISFKFVSALSVFVVAAMTAFGIVIATMGLWLPRV